MEAVKSSQALQNIMNHHELCVVYFTGSACSACEVIKLKVETILANYPEVKGIEVNGKEHPEIAISYDVYALPLMILFVQGKESLREGKHLNLLEFERKLERYVKLIANK